MGFDIVKVGLVVITFVIILAIGMIVTQSMEDSTVTATSEGLLTSSIDTLSNTNKGFTSASVYNQTWLNFDGTDDSLTVTSAETVISFWYKNSTTDWQHVVNNSGTTYVNGSAATPSLYPIYYDGTDYYLGKSDGSTFVDVSIDDFRVYNAGLGEGDAEGLYLLGRA